MKKLFLYIAFITTWISSAQIYPVQVASQLVPPYSLKLSDYETTSAEKLFVNLLLTDTQELGRQVRLKMYIKGQSINVQSLDFVAGATPIFLDGGINTRLSNLDLKPYFNLNNLTGITPQQYNQALPDGSYSFCFEVFDFFSGQSISRKSCFQVFLILNDPPFLNLPNKGDLVTAQNPQNILFTWTPRHINATNVQYEFTLKELWDTGINPQAAFLSSPPLHQETSYAPTLLYGPANIQLLEGKTYGWQVRALVSDGISETSVFRNNGYSEIYHFKYAGNCNTPAFIISEAQNSQTVQVSWQFSEHLRYEIQYRKKGYGDDDWFKLISYNQQATIHGLEAGTIYEFRVGGECTQNGGFAFSEIHEFTTPTEDEEAYYNCGIPPEINISNQNPLLNLGINEVFTAGDFPVTVKEISGGNGVYSGWGFITVPYFAHTKIRVVFNDIYLNNDLQLVDGVITTDYNAEWSNIEVIPDTQDILDLLDLFGDEEEVVYQDVSNTNQDVGNTNNPYTNTNNPDTNTNNPNTNNSDTSNNNDSNNTNTSNTGTENTDTSNNSDPNNTGTSNTDTTNDISNVYIVYNGDKYSDGDIIEVPYDDNQTNFAFLLKDYPENATFNWQVLITDTDVTSNHAENETIRDNFGIDTGSRQKLDIVANYNDKKITVTLQRRSQFDFQNLVALPADNTKRKAYHGETLYLINHDFNNKRNINYGIVTNPNLSNNSISSQDIAWYYDSPNTQTNLGKNFGKRDLHLSLTKDLDNNYLVAVEAGNPNSLNKDVNVKWVDRAFSKDTEAFDNGINLLPQLEQLAQKLGIPIYHDKSDFDAPGSLSILSDIKFETTIQNKEDKESRLIYNEKKQTFKVSLGLKAKIEMPVPGMAIPPVDKTFLGVSFKLKAGLYFFMEAAGYGEVGNTKFTEDWIEQKQQRNKVYVEALVPSRILITASIGLDPKIVIEAGDNISGSISGKSDAFAEIIKYDLLENELSFPILDDGFQLRCKPTAHLTLWSWSYSHQFDEYIYNVNW